MVVLDSFTRCLGPLAVLVSYHFGQPVKLREGITNGAILTLTHVGLALVLVLAGR